MNWTILLKKALKAFVGGLAISAGTAAANGSVEPQEIGIAAAAGGVLALIEGLRNFLKHIS